MGIEGGGIGVIGHAQCLGRDGLRLREAQDI